MQAFLYLGDKILSRYSLASDSEQAIVATIWYKDCHNFFT